MGSTLAVSRAWVVGSTLTVSRAWVVGSTRTVSRRLVLTHHLCAANSFDQLSRTKVI